MIDALFFTKNLTQPIINYYSDKKVSIWPKMLSFISLPQGWHYGEGVPASLAAHTTAQKVVSLLTKAGASDIDAFPDENGGITLNSYLDNSYFEFNCNSDSEIEMLVDPDGDASNEIDDEVFTLEQLSQILGNKPWKPANSFVLYTLQNTTTIKEFSPSKPSAGLVPTKAYR